MCASRCDLILSYGKGLRQLSYSMVEARLSDHRPVIAKFFVEVEAVNCQKLTKACKLSKHAKVNVEELLLKDFSVNNIRSLFNNEML